MTTVSRFNNSAGHKMEAEVEDKIEAYIDGEIEELPLATKENIGRTIDYSAGRNRYIGHLISIATRSFKDMRIGLDCANEFICHSKERVRCTWRKDICDQ